MTSGELAAEWGGAKLSMFALQVRAQINVSCLQCDTRKALEEERGVGDNEGLNSGWGVVFRDKPVRSTGKLLHQGRHDTQSVFTDAWGTEGWGSQRRI